MTSPPDFKELMNSSLKTKVGIYENMAKHLGERPVIFTSRPEIWSKETNPMIIVGHPFPSVSPSHNPKPSDLTREMMGLYRKLTTQKKKGRHHHKLMLCQFQVRGTTEVHAVFSRGGNNATDLPAEFYFKYLDHTNVLTRQYSTKSNSAKTLETSVPMALASEVSFARTATISGAVRTVDVSMMIISDAFPDIGPIESRLGTEICENLDEKVKLFQDNASSIVHGIMFTNVPGLWNPKIPWRLIEHAMPRIPDDYDHKRFDIQDDIFGYLKHVPKIYEEFQPFFAHSRKFGDEQFADVHLFFTLPREYKEPSSTQGNLSAISANAPSSHDSEESVSSPSTDDSDDWENLQLLQNFKKWSQDQSLHDPEEHDP